MDILFIQLSDYVHISNAFFYNVFFYKGFLGLKTFFFFFN